MILPYLVHLRKSILRCQQFMSPSPPNPSRGLINLLLTSAVGCAYNDSREDYYKECERNPMENEIIAHPLNIAEVMAYGYVGSRLYGLVTNESDTDLALITHGKAKSAQKVMDNMDYRIYSIHSFIQRLNATRLSETDLLMSGTMTMLDPMYKSYLNSFRVNSLEYIKQSEQLIHSQIRNVSPSIMEDMLQYKSLKAAVRCGMLSWKMIEQRGGFNPVFSDKEKAQYWEIMETLTVRVQNGETSRSLTPSLHAICRKAHGV